MTAREIAGREIDTYAVGLLVATLATTATLTYSVYREMNAATASIEPQQIEQVCGLGCGATPGWWGFGGVVLLVVGLTLTVSVLTSGGRG